MQIIKRAIFSIAVLGMLIFTMPFSTNAAGMSFAWLKSYSTSSTGDDRTFRTTKDSAGNLYVTGGSIIGAGLNYNGRLIKYNSAGTLLWNITYNTGVGPYGTQDIFWDVTTDSTGANVYVSGYYNVLSSAGGGVSYSMATIVKYTSAGAFVWAKSYSPVGAVATASNVARSIDIDAADNPYLGIETGTTSGRDCRVIKYDPSGNILLNIVYNKAAQDFGADTAVDSAGNIYLSCGSSGTQDIIKYNSAGTLLWDYARADTTSWPAIAVDSAFNVYATTYSINTTDTSTFHFRTMKLNSAGTPLWNTTKVTIVGKAEGGSAVGTDAAGNVYVGGYTTNADTTRDAVLLKYDSGGSLLDSVIYNAGGTDSAAGLVIDAAKSIFVSIGTFFSPSNNASIGLAKFTQGCSGTVAVSWTDPTLTANTTKIRKVHIDELRSWIDNRRVDAGLGGYSWTDPTLTANVTKIRKVHIDELRTAISQVYTTCGQAAPSWTDSTLNSNATKIRAVHLNELRSAVTNAL